MASIAPSPVLQLRPLRSCPNRARFIPRAVQSTISSPSPPKAFHGRREWLLLLTASTMTVGAAAPASAKDIPLFGLRKKMVNLEEEAVEIIKEGEKAVEKEIETVEKEIETVEKEVSEVEAEIEEAVAASNLAQAEALVVVEALAVLVTTSVVNAILKPLAQKS